MYRSTQVYSYAVLQAYRSTGLLVSLSATSFLHVYTTTRLHVYTPTRLHVYTSTGLHKYEVFHIYRRVQVYTSSIFVKIFWFGRMPIHSEPFGIAPGSTYCQCLLLYNSSTALLLYCSTALLLYCSTTALLLYCSTALLLDCSTALVL